MNTKVNLILLKNEDKTSDISSCTYNKQTHKYDVTFISGKKFSYNYNNVEWLKDPELINPANVRISHGDRQLFDIQSIYVFRSSYIQYWRICFANGSERSYNFQDLKITKSCLSNSVSKNCLEYLKQIAAINELRTEDGTILLAKQYENIDFVGEDTALSVYLNPQNPITTYTNNTLCFPFGGNSSQFNAVHSALTNQISVIQGPPGTGKTQTILNIIANLLIEGKTVQVVSNNNSATLNVLEKLSSEKYGLGFVVASLGSSANKAEFIKNQTGKYPDFTGWKTEHNTKFELRNKIQLLSNELSGIFLKQERLAKAKQELDALGLENKYYKLYCDETDNGSIALNTKRKIRSKKVMELWQECFIFSKAERPISFWYKLKSVFVYGISDWNFYKSDLSKIITLLQGLFYKTRQRELSDEIINLERELKAQDASGKLNKLTTLSMRYLRGILYDKYGSNLTRKIFNQDDLWQKSNEVLDEHPVTLSTTFSSRSSLGKDTVYDYLIIDEASQVDVATGAMALSCAKNVVIVGDLKQLPNVVSEDLKKRSNVILELFNIDKAYSFAENSFLQSVCSILPNVHQTLLKEHYRCHPKIIGFCNQKFYNNELIVMTEDKSETDVLSLFKTVAGNHKRDNLNQRQIDVLSKEALPYLKKYNIVDVGVIAPYNDQVNTMKKQIESCGIDIATVHKFQGREKDTIILTMVDDVITEFTDNPNFLNVAISRAKKKLCLIISGNEQPSVSNISDLISYIEYNNMEIIQSEIYSVFDYLYQHYSKERLNFLKKHKKISEFDSENLMFGLINDVLSKHPNTALGVVTHLPLNMLIRDPKLLNDEECKYAMNTATHLDFLIYNKISKKPVLAIEVDGFRYHKEGTLQAERDKKKNHILDLYKIPCLRLSTNGSGEREKLKTALGI